MGSGQPTAPAPVAPPPAAAPAAPVVKVKADEANPPDPLAAKTPILFVDDEPAVVGLLATYFQKRGYPVATAVDGVEALQVLAARPFEAVIADLNMPRLDGWGLLRLVREDFRTQEIPVALYSAQDDYRDKLRLLHAGAQAFFPKTLRLSVLELQVRELVEPRRRFLRLVDAGMALTHEFGSLGPQWVLKQLAGKAFTGELEARDAWASWRLWFEGGRLMQAQSVVGGATLSGDRALSSFLSSKQVEGTLSPGGHATQEGFNLEPTEAIVTRTVQRLNEEHGRAREDQLSRAKALSVNDDVYQLYTTVGPPAWMPIVRLLCEQKMTPAQVIQTLRCTPMDVASVVKDLLRRGVVSLRA
jgi:CheY-like chemotaxis protein